MAVNEERDCLVCREVLHLQDGQGRALEAAWKAAASGGFHVEIGADHDGFHHKVVKEDKGI